MIDLVKTLSETLRAKQWKMTCAESCTGGMIAAAMTDLAGSSDIFDRGFVTYSNDAKVDLLGVSPSTLATHGAVSAETAAAMADGALQHSLADIAVSVTGIAGPSGSSSEKPVGLVFIGLARKGAATTAYRHLFHGNRGDIRRQARDAALGHIRDCLADIT